MKDDPMTQTTYLRRLWQRLRLSLTRSGNPAPRAAHLSDHMRRDIGMPRDPNGQWDIQSLHDAMRYSG
jgi:hypothetical protein